MEWNSEKRKYIFLPLQNLWSSLNTKNYLTPSPPQKIRKNCRPHPPHRQYIPRPDILFHAPRPLYTVSRQTSNSNTSNSDQCRPLWFGFLFEGTSYNRGSSLNDIQEFEGYECQADCCNCNADKTVLAKFCTSKTLTSSSPMEMLYYSVLTTEPLCLFCGREILYPDETKKYNPLCNGCKEKGLEPKERPHNTKNNKLSKSININS